VIALRDAGILTPAQAETLTSSLRLFLAVQGLLRLTIEGHFHEKRVAEISEGLKEALVTTTSAEDFEALKSRMDEAADAVYRLYMEMIGVPARTVKKRRENEEGAT
jgi:hypothetical protein